MRSLDESLAGAFVASIFALLLVAVAATTARAAEPEESAQQWRQQAADTRAQVVAVAEELEQIDPGDRTDARGLVADAKRWLAKGDEEMDKADAAMDEGEFQAASSTYNMAWQYYVKAATAGLNAKRMLAE